MLIWRGWGILTLPIIALVGGLVVVTTLPLLKQAGLSAGLAMVAGLLAAAVANWFVGKRLNSAPARELVDQATGERVVLRRSHDLFFIPMQWWSVLLVAAAVVGIFSMLFGAETPGKVVSPG